MTKEKSKELHVSSQKKAYLRGQRFSNYIEAVTVGWTPLFLQIANIAIAILTGFMVAHLLPDINHGEWKMSLINVLGALIALYVPSRIYFMAQIHAERNRLTKYGEKANLNEGYMDWVRGKMTGDMTKNIAQVILGTAIMLGVHAMNIGLMIMVFSDNKAMRELGIEGSANAYIILSFFIEGVSCAIDIFLGFTTSLRIDHRKYFPDEDEIIELIERSEQYTIFLDKVNAVKKVQDAKEKEIKDKKESSGNGNKSGSGNSGNRGSGNNSNSGSGNKTITLVKPNGPLPDFSGVAGTSELIARVLTGTNFHPQKFNKALNRVGNTQRRGLTDKLGILTQKLRNLYQQGADKKKWEDNSDKIWEQIENAVGELTKVIAKTGYHIKMIEKNK